MKLLFTEKAWEDYLWLSKNNIELHKKANIIIKDIQRTPYSGLGKPEKLKGSLQGYYSRRLNLEHRIVYQLKMKQLFLLVFCIITFNTNNPISTFHKKIYLPLRFQWYAER